MFDTDHITLASSILNQESIIENRGPNSSIPYQNEPIKYLRLCLFNVHYDSGK